jgi:lambda repressor-like predicted transcriptional regulator
MQFKTSCTIWGSRFKKMRRINEGRRKVCREIIFAEKKKKSLSLLFKSREKNEISQKFDTQMIDEP